MPISLCNAFVPAARQILGGMTSIVDKAQRYAAEQGRTDAELMEARLAPDMWPLPWHVRACWMHSAYALDQLAGGEFTPDFSEVPGSWEAMRALLGQADERLTAATEEEVEAIAGRPVAFIMNGKRLMELEGTRFLLQFNQPNLYFHATTFYDILRMIGAPLTKMDFMGQLPVQR